MRDRYDEEPLMVFRWDCCLVRSGHVSLGKVLEGTGTTKMRSPVVGFRSSGLFCLWLLPRFP